MLSSITPAIKRGRIADAGATVVVDGDNYDEAEAAARARAQETGTAPS